RGEGHVRFLVAARGVVQEREVPEGARKQRRVALGAFSEPFDRGVEHYLAELVGAALAIELAEIDRDHDGQIGLTDALEPLQGSAIVELGALGRTSRAG